MGGTVIKLETERVIKRSKAQMIIEMGQEFGLDDTAILTRLQEKIGVSLERAKAYLVEYGKQLV